MKRKSQLREIGEDLAAAEKRALLLDQKIDATGKDV